MTFIPIGAKIAYAMDENFQKKCEEFKNRFAPLSVAERYEYLIELGRQMGRTPYPLEHRTEDCLVRGCQSLLYLHATAKEGKIYFTAAADALISAGLAALLIALYSDEPPEVILKCPPLFISELGIGASLSLNRSNGFAHIHLKMKQEALKFLLVPRP